MFFKKKGFTITELLGTILIITIVISIGVGSYNLASEKIKKQAYDNKVMYIETGAANYANDTGFLITNVDHLVRLGYIDADDEDGNVINPIDGSFMNCHIVNIYKGENFYGEYTDLIECNNEDIQKKNIFLEIHLYETDDDITIGKEIENATWTRKNVILEPIFKKKDINLENITKIVWLSNTGRQEILVNKDFDAKSKYLVNALQIINTTFSVRIEFLDGTVYQAETIVKIDKQRPIIYEDEIMIEKEEIYTSSDKEVTVVASDGNGSGIYGYSISSSSDCVNASYEENHSEIYTKKKDAGTFYVCVKDNVGNISEDVSTKIVTIDKIDRVLPTIKAKKDPLSLGTSNYEFKDNLEVTYGVSGGKVVCNPTLSKKTGSYTVTCTAVGNNGLTASTTFHVQHSYKPTYVSVQCEEKCVTCSNPYNCSQPASESWRNGTVCTYICDDGSTRENVRSYTCTVSPSCPDGWGGAGNSYKSCYRPSGCKKATCPNGGTYNSSKDLCEF